MYRDVYKDGYLEIKISHAHLFLDSHLVNNH